jgi:hypothetical protein
VSITLILTLSHTQGQKKRKKRKSRQQSRSSKNHKHSSDFLKNKFIITIFCQFSMKSIIYLNIVFTLTNIIAQNPESLKLHDVNEPVIGIMTTLF